jgi:hypothetical protein
MQNELVGVPALVHPELKHDPAAHRQNEIGLIKLAYVFSDERLLGFADGTNGLYATDALLILLPTEQIHQNLSELDYDTSFREIKPLIQIDLFLRYTTDEKQRIALELARNNRNIHQYCLKSLESSLNRDQSHGYE